MVVHIEKVMDTMVHIMSVAIDVALVVIVVVHIELFGKVGIDIAYLSNRFIINFKMETK